MTIILRLCLIGCLCFLPTTVCAQQYISVAKERISKVYGYIDITGEYIIEPQFAYAQSFCKEGFAPVFDNFNNEVYFIDIYGEAQFRSTDEYDLIIPQGGSTLAPNFVDGMLLVTKDEKFGCIDVKGRLIIPTDYDSITSFNNGLAIAKRLDAFFVIDKYKNEILIENSSITSVRRFSEGFASFMSKDGMQGYINSKGEVVIEEQFLYEGPFVNGLARASYTERHYGYIDTLGNWKIPQKYSHASDFSVDDKVARVRNRVTEEEGYLFLNGFFFHPVNGQSFGDFSEGLASATHERKRGFINIFGQWAIPPTFEYFSRSPFSGGVTIMEKNHSLGVIDCNGNWVVEPRFSSMGNFVKVEPVY